MNQIVIKRRLGELYPSSHEVAHPQRAVRYRSYTDRDSEREAIREQKLRQEERFEDLCDAAWGD